MVLVDLFCNNKECGFIEEDVMVDTKLKNHGICAKCGKGILKRMVPGQMTFELKYNNKTDMCDWDGNTSQYWNQIKSEGGDLPEKDRDKWY